MGVFRQLHRNRIGIQSDPATIEHGWCSPPHSFYRVSTRWGLPLVDLIHPARNRPPNPVPLPQKNLGINPHSVSRKESSACCAIEPFPSMRESTVSTKAAIRARGTPQRTIHSSMATLPEAVFSVNVTKALRAYGITIFGRSHLPLGNDPISAGAAG
jgi:hypothetical protein